jgi:MFS family permease
LQGCWLNHQELPSNILLRKVGARVWLGGIVTGFGIVTIGQAFTKTWWQLAICRVLLGLLESESSSAVDQGVLTFQVDSSQVVSTSSRVGIRDMRLPVEWPYFT